MKLNLQCGNNVLSDYINTDNQPASTNRSVSAMNYDAIPSGFTDVEEILFNPPLNTISPNKVYECIGHWHDKLMLNGRLIVNFYDFYLLATDAKVGNLNLSDAHGMVFGQESHEFKSLVGLSDIQGVLLSLGFVVENIWFDKYKVIVEAKKE